MASLYGTEWMKEELLKRVGDISQICGVKVHRLVEGPADGVLAIDLWTGGGLTFTVLASRGLDISTAHFRGVPLSWKSPTFEVHPAFYEPEGFGWLRGFYGGLLTTCGLSHYGVPVDDEEGSYGLHGRASYTPAYQVSWSGDWQGDEYFLTVEGKIRETAVFAPVLELHRRYQAFMGQNRIVVTDRVRNIGFQRSPLMLLYHLNLGFPLVDEGSELLSPSLKVVPRDEVAAPGLGEHSRFSAPISGYREQVFFHRLAADRQGTTCVGVVNRSLFHGDGLGFYARWNVKELPHFVEWKMMGEGTYVVGLEPCTTPYLNRALAKASGSLDYLNPGEERTFRLELGVLSSRAEIEQFRQFVAELALSAESSERST
ncbi:MAG: aldose 1-epimerase family protein [Armatimonadetes bacterium]|nr:aldose 1-epimerase family protein [Armatimonadota bacterium]MDW8121497.1 aldose 1-epimerase family protein [Armatimonadota bacterium]